MRPVRAAVGVDRGAAGVQYRVLFDLHRCQGDQPERRRAGADGRRVDWPHDGHRAFALGMGKLFRSCVFNMTHCADMHLDTSRGID